MIEPVEDIVGVGVGDLSRPGAKYLFVAITVLWVIKSALKFCDRILGKSFCMETLRLLCSLPIFSARLLTNESALW